MPICCCVTTGQVIESWDLPVESEHEAPKRMSALTPPPRDEIEEERMGVSSKNNAHKNRDIFLRVGAVAIPPGTSQGLQLLHSFYENLVIICDVAAGPWQKWNEAHPEHQVKAGDELVEVNGRSGDYKDIIREMTIMSNRSRLLTMLIRRPIERAIRVPRPMKEESVSEICPEEAKSLGVLLLQVNNSGLFVDAIHDDGAVDLWNRDNAGQQVRVLDRIVKVNGVLGTPLQLVEAMKQPGDCELVLHTHSM
mmetsp:Transcript_29381/g.68270  ORF Transcript_29381/g.68270 Transcript_29381/m.68270 type:complete len:251 (+) Transcript_29381:69-821(+)